MDTVTAVLVGVVIGALAVVFGRRLLGGGGADLAPQCTALVRLSLSGNKIEARPENACLHKGRRLNWEVKGGAGDKVEIDFEKPEEPFEHPGNNPHNPRPGHYETTGPAEIDSNPSKATGRFKYTVKWTPAGGGTITLDPEVCIRGG